MKRKSYISCLILVSLFLLFSRCNSEKSKNKMGNSQEKPNASVDGYIVKPTLLENNITVSGSLLAFEEVTLMNEIAGRIVFINLPEGKFVKKGTLLVQLFDDDLQANLKKLQTQLSIQEKILERQDELLKVNGISQYDYDQTYLQVNSIKAEIEVQRTLIRKSQVLAPFDGVIGLRTISIGAQVTPFTPLAMLRMENRLKLDFSVPEKYSSEIKQGLKVKFTVSGNNKEYKATVFATEGGIETSTRNLKVRAIVNGNEEYLIPGAFTSVQLVMGENKNAILIPSGAIIPKERTKSVIVAKGGTAHFVEVRTGVRTASSIEITDGINTGDTVVTNGILFLKEGDKISFSTLKTELQ